MRELLQLEKWSILAASSVLQSARASARHERTMLGRVMPVKLSPRPNIMPAKALNILPTFLFFVLAVTAHAAAVPAMDVPRMIRLCMSSAPARPSNGGGTEAMSMAAIVLVAAQEAMPDTKNVHVYTRERRESLYMREGCVR
jgi:hypothetical protein